MADAPSFIASVIANPARPVLDAALLRRVAEALGLRAADVAVLREGVAAEFAVAGEAPVLLARLREATAGLPVDTAVLPAAGRCKRLFMADMDSTMIEQECIDELADMVGLKGPVSSITERAMRGEIAFEPALRERVALLRGLPSDIAGRIIAERITLTPGGRTLVATMRANGAWTCLVSGGFTVFADPIGATLGFEEVHANHLEVAGDALAGTVAEPILGRDAKRDTLIALRERLGLPRDAVLAVGDGANDLAMLSEAGLGAAFRAKPAVAAVAGARIDHGDLTALLYLQGYRAEEFVSA